MTTVRGVYTAIVTPLRHGKVDETALAELIEKQIAGGVDGIVPAGTTGESPTLSTDEHVRVIELAVQMVNGRIQVMAGTGANSTAEAIHLTQAAEKLGADSSLQVTPYYNKPSQAGLTAHFSAIAQATKLPLTLYSIPGRCGVEIGVETMANLAVTHANIVSIKEAGGSVDRVSQLRQALPANFSIMCGDDALTLPFLSVGAVGVISVASNVAPRDVVQLVRLWHEGRAPEAEAQHRRLYPLFRDLFVETNPVPVKAALARAGWMVEDVRLPLVTLPEASREKLNRTLAALGL